MIDINPVTLTGNSGINLDSNSKISSGWFILQFLTALTSIRYQNYQKQYNLTLTSKNQITYNCYEQFLTYLQYISISSDKSIKLYPIQKQLLNKNHQSIKSNSKCIIKTVDNWQPSDISISFKKISSNLYSVKTPCEQLINDDRIQSLHNVLPRRFLNRYTNGFLQSGSENGTFENDFFTSPHPLYDLGLHGENQIIAVTDTGLDSYHNFFYDPSHPTIEFNQTIENHRKIAAYYSIADTKDDILGHGTHVTGTALGEANDSNSGISLYNGVAPKSKVFFLGIGSSDSDAYDTDFNGDDVYNLMSASGVSICCNAWGYDGFFDSFDHLISIEYDKFAYDHPEMTFVFSAGNQGEHNSSPQMPESYYTINSPGTSKNCLSVGFTTNTKLSTLENQQEYILEIDGETTIGMKYDGFNADPYKYPIQQNPMKKQANLSLVYFNENSDNFDDSIVYIDALDDFCTTVYSCSEKGATAIIHKGETEQQCSDINHPIPVFTINEEIPQDSKKGSIVPIPITDQEMALSTFSSRGPSLFLIHKPDVVVPGENIISANAGDPNIEEPRPTTFDTLKSSSGSSMATPAVSGILALIRQFFEQGFYPSRKENAADCIKEITSNFLRAVLINSAQPFETNKYGPNCRTGFGIPNIQSSLLTPLRVIPNENIDSNSKHVYEIHVNEHNESDLRITMAYLDPPLNFMSRMTHFVDLDLLVTSPSGKLYFGNGYTNNQTETSNTIERVIIPKSEVETGTYQITVLSTAFQDSLIQMVNYSIVINGPFDHYDYDTNPVFLSKINKDNQCQYQCLNNGICNESVGRCQCDDSHTGVNCGIELIQLNIQQNYQLEINHNRILYTKVVVNDVEHLKDTVLVTEINSTNTVYQLCVSSTPFYSLSDNQVTCIINNQNNGSLQTPLTITSDGDDNALVYIAIKTSDPIARSLSFKFEASYAYPTNKPIITVPPTEEAVDHPEERWTESNLAYSTFFVVFCIVFGFVSFIFILLNIAYLILRFFIYQRFPKKEA